MQRFEFQKAVDTGDYDIIHPRNIRSECEDRTRTKLNVNSHSFCCTGDLIVLPFLIYAHLFIMLICHWVLQTDIIITL